MGLNFGQNFLPPKGEMISSFDFKDIISGQSYITFFCNYLGPKATIYESYTAGDDTDNEIDETDWLTQTFTVGNTGVNETFWINGCELFMKGAMGSARDLTVSIQKLDGANKPDGTDIAIGKQEEIEFSATAQWHKITFNSPTLLESSTSYALVVRVDLLGSSWQWRSDNSAPSYTGGQYGVSNDVGETWTMDSSKDFLFKILGDTTPALTFTRQQIDAPPITIIRASSTTEYKEAHKHNTYLEFNKSANLKGKVIIKTNMTVNMGENNENLFGHFDYELIKIEGTSETSLGTATSKYEVFDSGNRSKTFGAQINLSSTEHFKKGDILKLKLTTFLKADDSTHGEITLKIEDFTIALPFKLDI